MKQDPAQNDWIDRWMRTNGVFLWGAADVGNIPLPPALSAKGLATAISWVVPMPPGIMAGIKNGPTREYARTYNEVNDRINRLASRLAEDMRLQGYRAAALAASERTDPINICGDFPHKTAATLSGIGWIGRHCQLIVRNFGPWVRLATVFTEMTVRCGKPVKRSFCGACRACIEACPAGALSGRSWYPGIPRQEILNAAICDQWKKAHYYDFNHGHNCGICAAVCPYGMRYLKRISGQNRLPSAQDAL